MIRETATGVSLAGRAQPGAKKTAITGVYGEGPDAQLKIAVQAPPIEGRANAVLIAWLAEFFSLSRTNVVLMSGETTRCKVFLLRGLTLAQAQTALANTLR